MFTQNPVSIVSELLLESHTSHGWPALGTGAIVGLAAMGPQVVRMQLLPNLEPYVALLEREMGDVTAGPTEGAAPRPSPLRRQEAARCFGALLAASAGAMYHRITQR